MRLPCGGVLLVVAGGQAQVMAGRGGVIAGWVGLRYGERCPTQDAPREEFPMIQTFSTLYAGHVLEGDGIGFDGVPANDRWYDNDRLATAMDIARQAAVFLDDLGFDILWMAEHHFQREGYECIPNLLIMSQYLAQHTKRIKFGCGFNILPMWHPIRLAEDFAMVDILTEGRVVFGIGRGYHTREVESFGAPMIDGDANRELFEEQFEIVMKAFSSEAFSHQGKHYTIPPEIPYRGYDLKEVTLVPRPRTQPVDVWQPIVSASDRALDFMAKWGIKGVILGTGQEYVEEWVHRYQAANQRAGRDLALGEGLCIGLWAMVDDSAAAARRQPGAAVRGAREVRRAAGDAALQRSTDRGHRSRRGRQAHRRRQ